MFHNRYNIANYHYRNLEIYTVLIIDFHNLIVFHLYFPYMIEKEKSFK